MQKRHVAGMLAGLSILIGAGAALAAAPKIPAYIQQAVDNPALVQLAPRAGGQLSLENIHADIVAADRSPRNVSARVTRVSYCI